MVPEKLPLQSSNIADVPKTKLFILEYILNNPDRFIGSVQKRQQSLWVYNPDSQVEYRSVRYVPGFYKIFDEILVNAANTEQLDCLKVDIDQKANLITVFNTGVGIAYNHMKNDITRINGQGIQVTIIFSTEFSIEIAYGKDHQFMYTQAFTNNMMEGENPITSECKASDNWTKVCFKPDLAKFNMKELEDDMVALMKKRVVDLAGCLSRKKVNVFLNQKKIVVKSFHDYAQFYLNSAIENQEVPLPRIDNNSTSPFWQISVSRSKGEFQQVSFANSINTIEGGTHVDYIKRRITDFIIGIVKKNNNVQLKPHIVENHLWIFVNAVIDNPVFDSQTKERLAILENSFETTCDLSDTFLKEVVDRSEVVESLLSQAEFEETEKRILDISELQDANEAGCCRSHDCTLILTKGDSAEALAMAWLSAVGREFFGVFPLRAKLSNVREASAKQISENAEINNIKMILGLKQGESYDEESSVKQLRYGHLMIMADKDRDGSHIKGLLINIIYTFWPSLFWNSSFVLEFDTPRIKGLGTGDSNEVKNNRKVFVWSDDKDGDEIELAFSKEKIDARKDWLQEKEVEISSCGHAEKTKFTYFVHKELKLFSRADLQRSIPSMVDGLTLTQRTVLFCAFEMNLVREINVADFSVYVSEKLSYYDSKVSTTIVGMAQNFVGSNNVNLLMPNGQFGTRRLGGKDAANYRYLHTKLADVTRSIFPEEDVVLSRDGRDGSWYMPIIPMVLVNGSEEMGAGWSTFIPNYNPRDIIANIRHLINNESLEPMDPWYKNFKGTIQRAVSGKESDVTYTVKGTIGTIDQAGGDVEEDDEGEGDVKLCITELPIRKWTQDYKEFVMTLKEEGFIKSFDYIRSTEAVEFSMVLSKKNYKVAKEDLMKKFKLTTSLTTSNMYLLDKDKKIVKYDSPEKILEDFYKLRLQYYRKRKELYLTELGMLDSKVLFILGVSSSSKIILCKKDKAKLLGGLLENGFVCSSHSWVKSVEPVGATEDEVAEGSEELGDYLVSMVNFCFITKELRELQFLRKQCEDLIKQSEQSLWLKDLDKLEKALEEKDKREAKAKVYASISNDPTKKPTINRKVTKAKPKLETTSSVAAVAMEKENPPHPAKGKGKAVLKKAPAKKGKTTLVEREAEDEDISDLLAWVAAYLDPSPKNLAVTETDAPPKQAASKSTSFFLREASKGILDSVQVIEEVSSPKPVKKGRGRKTQQPAATKKRAPARKRKQPITDEMVDASPNKKVRKTRPSEVTKMRSSSLNRRNLHDIHIMRL